MVGFIHGQGKKIEIHGKKCTSLKKFAEAVGVDAPARCWDRVEVSSNGGGLWRSYQDAKLEGDEVYIQKIAARNNLSV